MYKDIEKVLVTADELDKAVNELAQKLNKDYEGKKVLLICVLKGAVFFYCDIAKKVNFNCELDFIKASSYGSSTTSSGNVVIQEDIREDMTGYDVLLVEDILDTGNTLYALKKELEKRNPNSVKIAILLDKKERRVADIEADYVGFNIPNDFVVGYGLDYDQKYRTLPYIGVLKEEIYNKS